MTQGLIETDFSGTITAGGTAQTLAAAGERNYTARYWYILNPADATEPLYVRTTGAAAVAGASSVKLDPGYAFQPPYPIANQVSVIATTTGHAFQATAAL